MNFGPPQWVIEAAEKALHEVPLNHYAHPKGCVRLRKAIKNFYGPQLGKDLDIESEILVSSGANEGAFQFIKSNSSSYSFPQGQYSVFTAFIEPGDEVIVFEPYFDQYLASVAFHGGTLAYVPLHPPPPSKEKPTSNDWTLDFEELRYDNPIVTTQGD